MIGYFNYIDFNDVDITFIMFKIQFSAFYAQLAYTYSTTSFFDTSR